MSTRYSEGQLVELDPRESEIDEYETLVFRVEDIEDRNSDSPEYFIENGSEAGWVKASEIIDFRAADSAIPAWDNEAVEDAEDRLFEQLKDFHENNEQFNFNEGIIDEQGFEAVILVDFGIEDMADGGGSYVGTVSAKINSQPVDDSDEIRDSRAFLTATNLLDEAVRALPAHKGYNSVRGEVATSDIDVYYHLPIIYNEELMR
jgi:hypothetical protein